MKTISKWCIIMLIELLGGKQMHKNMNEVVAELLKSVPRYISQDGKLLKATVYTETENMNGELLKLLLSQEQVKAHFFTEVDKTYVFDKQKFKWFIMTKEFLPGSYTRYANKIGLTHDNKFLSQMNEVVLDFPHKDCVLQGGQDKEDQKRDEILYHEIIESDKISRMFEKKVLTNARKFDTGGTPVPEI